MWYHFRKEKKNTPTAGLLDSLISFNRKIIGMNIEWENLVFCARRSPYISIDMKGSGWGLMA